MVKFNCQNIYTDISQPDLTLIKVEGQPDKYSCMCCEKKFLRNGTGVISRHIKNKHSEKLKDSKQCTLISCAKLVAPFKVVSFLL
jgi:hypothetical protein